jgi:hypothetical protein
VLDVSVQALSVTFQLAGQQFMALNGGPDFKFTEAISLLVNGDTQDEIDRFWATLTAGGGEPRTSRWSFRLPRAAYRFSCHQLTEAHYCRAAARALRPAGAAGDAFPR